MLRKRYVKDPPKEDDYKDLLVFGYSSKLFQDDEKALEIDRGKHLIPWMGDGTLTIDRYDGRGHLDDLRQFTSEAVIDMILTEEEKAREKELDEERYMDLFFDIEEKLMYEEEEMKRSSEAEVKYGAVSFEYEEQETTDGNSKSAQQDEKADDLGEDSELFVWPEHMDLPPGIEMPKTLKQHKVVEKTADFLSKQSLQMEILIKTRQKDNPSFNFLNFDDALHPYYKHLLSEMKQGRYSVSPAEKEEVKPDEPAHVEIQISSQEFLKSVEEKLPPRLVKDTSYDKLLNNLRKHIPVQPPVVITPPTPHPPSQLQPSNALEDSAASSAHDQSSSLPQTPVAKTTVESQRSAIVPPPPDKKFLVDKMASYVARNGPDFESVVKKKNDQRFDFLAEGHLWHNYYKMRKVMLEQEMLSRRPKTTEKFITERECKMELKSISFSIKSKEISDKVTKQNILNDEEAAAERLYKPQRMEDIDAASLMRLACHRVSPPADLTTLNPTCERRKVVAMGSCPAPTESKWDQPIKKRPHSPELVTSKKQRSRSKTPEYGPKPRPPEFSPKSRSPVYGPELPVAHLPQNTNHKILNIKPEREMKSSNSIKTEVKSESNGLMSKFASPRESSSKVQDVQRSPALQRHRCRSRSDSRRSSRSKRRKRSPSIGKIRPKSPRRSRSRRRSKEKCKPRKPVELKQSRKISPTRSRSRDSSRRRRSIKKSKHRRKHSHHHHHRHNRNSGMVVLDLTRDEVVDLTQD